MLISFRGSSFINEVRSWYFKEYLTFWWESWNLWSWSLWFLSFLSFLVLKTFQSVHNRLILEPSSFSFQPSLTLSFLTPSGVALPWYFPFTKTYWCGGNVSSVDGKDKTSDAADNDDDEELEALTEKRDESENGSEGKKFGVRVCNLRKVFGNRCGKDATRYKVAVRGISMDMAEDEIFVLLGHNGAGKSTTISMLTGQIWRLSDFKLVVLMLTLLRVLLRLKSVGEMQCSVLWLCLSLSHLL